jgi:hypothetical protein
VSHHWTSDELRILSLPGTTSDIVAALQAAGFKRSWMGTCRRRRLLRRQNLVIAARPHAKLEAVLLTLDRLGPMTRDAIEIRMGLSTQAAGGRLQRLHWKYMLVHIHDWVLSGNVYAPVYAAWPGRDKPQPRAVSQTNAYRRARAAEKRTRTRAPEITNVPRSVFELAASL